MHGLNMLDYGARHIDMADPQWRTIDPLAEKYYSISPYAYCLNNPIKYVDRDGREARISKGTGDFQKRTFNDLQKLTRQKLLLLKNGKVVNASKYKGKESNILLSGEEAKPVYVKDAKGRQVDVNSKEYGTQLVDDVISHREVITISEATSSEKNEIGVETLNLSYDPDSENNGVLNEDGSYGIDAFITLGHELIHGRKIQNKTRLSTEDWIRDPDSPDNWSSRMSKEEYDTRKKENYIRKENGKKPRYIPKPPQERDR